MHKTTSVNDTKQKVYKLLEEAEQKAKKNDYSEAFKKLEEASSHLTQVVATDSKDSIRNVTIRGGEEEVQYLSKRGNILYDLKEYGKALECYQAVRDKQNNIDSIKSLGDCKRKMGKYQEALELYDEGHEACEQGGGNETFEAALLNSRGLTYMRMKKYQEAFDDFQTATSLDSNPLYFCNQGHAAYALGNKKQGLDYFKQAKKYLDNKGNHKGALTGSNLDFIQKTLQQFIEMLQDLNEVSMEEPDDVIDAREVNFVQTTVCLIINGEDEEEGEKGKRTQESKAKLRKTFSNVIALKRAELKKAKLSVIDIKKDKELYHFYVGFLSTFTKCYKTVEAIEDNKLTANNNDINLAVELIPLVGSKVCAHVDSIATFAKSKDVTDASTNISKLALDQAEFLGIAQDALIQIIQEIKNGIKAKAKDLDKTALLIWTSRFQAVVKKIEGLKLSVDETLYRKLNDTSLQKFGYQIACTLISSEIGSGKLYEGKAPLNVEQEEKIKRLKEAAVEIFKQSFDENYAEPPPTRTSSPIKNQHYTEVTTETKNEGCCKSDGSKTCQMF